MSEPEEPFVIPMASEGLGRAKWVAVGALVIVALLGTWLGVTRMRESNALDAAAEEKRLADEAHQKKLEERRKQAKGGRSLASAHMPPPGWEPPKNRIPSKELFKPGDVVATGMLPTTLPGGQFSIDLPAKWEQRSDGGLMVITAPDGHFTIVAGRGTHRDDGNTKRAIDKIGAVHCNWRKGDGPRHGKLGPRQIPAFFNEGVCGHTDGYGLIWIVRVFEGDDDVTSLVARYDPKAGEDAEDVLIAVLRTIARK